MKKIFLLSLIYINVFAYSVGDYVLKSGHWYELVSVNNKCFNSTCGGDSRYSWSSPWTTYLSSGYGWNTATTLITNFDGMTLPTGYSVGANYDTFYIDNSNPLNSCPSGYEISVNGQSCSAPTCTETDSQNEDCTCKTGYEPFLDAGGNQEGCQAICEPHALTPPIGHDDWIDLEQSTQELCMARLEFLEIDGSFTSGDNGCGLMISTCFGSPESACWNVADIEEIIGDSNFVYKGLVSNSFECQADGINYMSAFVEETNPNCKRINNLYCFKLPINQDDENLTAQATPPTTTEDLNTSAQVPNSEIKTAEENPVLYISSIDTRIGKMSENSQVFYRDVNGKLQEMTSSLNTIAENDKSTEILDYITQDVSTEIALAKESAQNEEDEAIGAIEATISEVIPTFSEDFFTAGSCGVFYMPNQDFNIMGGSSTFDMSSVNTLMNSNDTNDLFLLMKVFLYFMIALSSFKIFVKVG